MIEQPFLVNDMDLQKTNLIALLHKDLWFFTVFILISIVFTIYFHSMLWIVITSCLGMTYWISRYYIRDKDLYFPYGIANVITLLRCSLLIIVTSLESSIPLIYLGLIFSILCLGDFIDGRIARTNNMTSTIGEYMDKETDALFVLYASMILYFRNIAGIWIILLGVIRYGYFLFMYFYIKPEEKEIKVPAARVIAVIVFISLLASFFISIKAANLVLMLSLILLIYSFGLSTLKELNLLK